MLSPVGHKNPAPSRPRHDRHHHTRPVRETGGTPPDAHTTHQNEGSTVRDVSRDHTCGPSASCLSNPDERVAVVLTLGRSTSRR
jgi:hypothetical protein